MTDIMLDHIHLRGEDPDIIAQFFVAHLGFTEQARQPIGAALRITIRLGDLTIFVETAKPGAAPAPSMPFRGIEHICLRVPDLDAFVGQLAQGGVHPTVPPAEIRPGVRMAFIEAPGRIAVELIQRDQP